LCVVCVCIHMHICMYVCACVHACVYTPACGSHCNTLQQPATTHCSLLIVATAATHCNTLQHTATHCNTLQYTAAHCNALRHAVSHCNYSLQPNQVATHRTSQLTATHCNSQHTATHCNTLQHPSILQQMARSGLYSPLLSRRYQQHSANAMTHSYVWHDAFIRVSWLIHTFKNGKEWIHSLMGVSWRIHTCVMAHSYVRMTHSYVCHDSFVCVPWLIRMCAMTHPYSNRWRGVKSWPLLIDSYWIYEKRLVWI